MTEMYDDRPPESDPTSPAGSDEDWDEDTPMAWEGRVIAVSLVWAMPGAMAGLFFALFAVTSPAASATVGGLLGALAGGLMEADYWD